MWIPAIRRTSCLSVAVAVLKTGKAPERGQVWYAACGRGDCCNPEHRKLGGRSEQMLALKLKRDPLTKARISRTKLAAGRCKVPPEEVARIRAERPLLTEIMERYGVSLAYASQLRSGKSGKRDAAAPNSSVWAMKA